MKFLLLKTLLLHKHKDQGFTLPIVIAIGLVMVLLSTVSLVQSGEENLIALSTESSADAFAIAEIGVARYRDLLLNNRVLAVRDLDEWTNFNDQTCNFISDTGNGWADNSATAWKNVDVAGNTIGSYRLVDYQYDRDPSPLNDDDDFDLFDDANNDTNGDGNSDARGFLTIQGQDLIGGVSQIQVEIPMGINRLELNTLNPALWIQQSSVGNMGNINLDSDGDGIFNEIGDGTVTNIGDGNIVFYRPGTAAGSNGCDDPGGANDNNISDSRELPPLMSPTNFTVSSIRTLNTNINAEVYTGAALGFDPSNFYNATTQEIVLGTIFDESTGGANDPTGSTQALNAGVGVNGEDIFYYSTQPGFSLNLNNGDAIIGDGDSKVIIYVYGDLNLNTGAGGTVRLVNASHTSETGGVTPPGIARYLEIHVGGNVNITGSGTVDLTGLLRVAGTVNIANSTTVNVIGSIWANNWSASGATINIDTDQTVVNGETVSESNFFTNTPLRTAAPITFRPSGWETQEVN